MKDIVGYEGLYAVTSCGRVWNHKKQRFLNISNTTAGYCTVALQDDTGKWKQHYVHRLVAMAYIPNPDNLPEVNHMNEIKQKNNIQNLEWCTRQYNLNYGTCQQRKAQTRRSS